MATYVIGDIQGCFATLEALLAQVRFGPRDRLWLTGDLVNRGPRSLDVLRFVADLGDRVTVVLGNHDLHLLGRHAGRWIAKRGDTLEEVLAAADADALVDWLARRPLLHREGDVTMVHAGLLPEWTVEDAARHASALAPQLATADGRRALFVKDTYPAALRALTTVRTCHADGTLCKHSGPPETAPAGCVPWFVHPARRSRGSKIVFGHWSALGVQRGPDYVALDSGCVWGQSLTALRLEDDRIFQEPARERPPRARLT